MKQGVTLVELVISIAALATISIMAMIYLVQTLESHDKALALAEATEVANTVLTRIGNSVKTAATLTVTGGTTLSVTEDTGCEVYQLSGQSINYGISTSPSPCPFATLPISNATANITNGVSPAITLFTVSNDEITVTTKLRVQVKRPFGTNEITLQDSASKRR